MRLLGIVISLFWLSLLVSSSDGQQPAAGEEKAQAAFKPLLARFDDPKADRERLRLDLIALRQSHPGTTAAVQAAELLRRLPSPLDQLDPAKIPALDRFDWQPKELVAVLTEHRGRQGSPVTCLAFSPDGKTVVSGGGSVIRFWDSDKLRQKHILGHGSVSCLAFSPDGKWLASGGSTVVQVFDLAGEAPKLKHTLPAGSNHVYSVAISNKGNKLVAGCGDMVCRMWSLSDEKPKEPAVIGGHQKLVASVALNPEGTLLASGSYDGTIQMWDLSGPQPKEFCPALPGNTKEVTAVAFSPVDGKTLAAGGLDGNIRLWSLTGPKPRDKAQFQAHKGHIYAIAFGPSGRTLATGGSDNTVRLWDVAKAQPTERTVLATHTGPVLALAYKPDGNVLATGGSGPDWTVRLWDLGTQAKERFPPKGHLSSVTSVAFAPDGKALSTGSHDQTLRQWTTTGVEPKERGQLKFDTAISSIGYSPDGKMLAACGSTTTVKLWDAANGKDIGVLKGAAGSIGRLVFSPDSKQLAAYSFKTLHLWDVKGGRELGRWDGHETYINSLAFSPDGKRLLSASGYYLLKDGKPVYENLKPVWHDCTIRLWEAETGRELAAIKNLPGPVYTVAFTPDGKRAFSGGYESEVRQWDMTGANPTEMKDRLKGTGGYGYLVVVSPDGQTVATNGVDGKVIVWETATGKRLHEWTFAESVAHLAFATDSRHLAVSIQTGPVYVLRLAAAEKKQ